MIYYSSYVRYLAMVEYGSERMIHFGNIDNLHYFTVTLDPLILFVLMPFVSQLAGKEPFLS